MRSYSLLAPAKINLYLEILGDRSDGYHELIMILQSIDLADRIHLRPLGVEQIQLHCDQPGLPQDQRNLAYQAAALMNQKFPGLSGVEITIQKQIPVGAGLAGGSTDAAAVLVGLDLMWNLGLTQVELQELAVQLGSDVPFCIGGGTALALGRGEDLSPLPDVDHLFVVLGKYRSLSVSTPWAYSQYRSQFGHTYIRDPADQKAHRQQSRSGSLLQALTKLAKAPDQATAAAVGQLLHNDLEQVVLLAFPRVQTLKDTFEQMDVLGTLMSGSGPTVFALTESRPQAERVRAAVRSALPDPDLDLWVTQFSSSGIQLTAND